MDESSPRDFFLAPSASAHKQYEALRCVFVDGVSQKDAAERFGYSYGAFRQLVLQFRERLRQGASPPFFSRPPRAAPRDRPRRNPAGPRRSSRLPPTPGT